MNHFQQTLALKATPATVYTALTTPEGLRGWWTEDCDVPSGVGETLHFRFGRTSKAMRIERLVPGHEVRWHCTGAHIATDKVARKDEWVGTELVFSLTDEGGGRTRLDFEHIGLVPEFECYAICNEGWRQCLGSLQQLVETGRGTPYEVALANCATSGNNATTKERTMNQDDARASTDRIERKVTIDAPRQRVWRALSNAETFGEWFGANLKGQTFAPGQRARGQIKVKGYEHMWFDVVVERIEPPQLLSYRWHPYPIDAAVDYSKEEPTLVTFTLSDAPGNGTLLTVVESGFDKVPPHRRMEAFRMNSGGWEGQMRNIVRYVTAS